MKRFLIIVGFCFSGALMVSASLASQKKEAITEITLEMTEGLANSCAFRIVLRKDGTAFYHGMANVKLLGKYEGTISKEEFAELADFLTARHFNKIKSTTGTTISATAPIQVSVPIVRTGVVEDGKRTTVVRAYKVKVNNPDPPAKKLLEIENAITTTATHIKWEGAK